MKPKTSSAEVEQTAKAVREKVVLRICDEHLAGTYELDVADIINQPKLAKHDQILAVPTLIKKLPLPLRKFIGDLSDRDVVLIGLDIKPPTKNRKAR